MRGQKCYQLSNSHTSWARQNTRKLLRSTCKKKITRRFVRALSVLPRAVCRRRRCSLFCYVCATVMGCDKMHFCFARLHFIVRLWSSPLNLVWIHYQICNKSCTHAGKIIDSTGNLTNSFKRRTSMMGLSKKKLWKQFFVQRRRHASHPVSKLRSFAVFAEIKWWNAIFIK